MTGLEVLSPEIMARRARPLAERFWARVDRSQYSPGGCWEWTGSHTNFGYGTIQCGSRTVGNRRPVLTHRLAYILSVGSLSGADVVRHRCNNPPCCNPAHLLIGTQLDNIRDTIEAGRNTRGEQHANAKLSVSDVIEIRSLRKSGSKSSAIALRFGILPRTVRQICQGKSWRSVGATP